MRSYAALVKFGLAPLLVFVVALLIRSWGIYNGLPYTQRPDETSDISEALTILQGDAPTYAYHRVAWSLAQIPVHGLQFLGQRLQSSDFDVEAFRALYFTDRGLFVASIRVYAALFSALACVLVYFAAMSMSGATLAGLLAGGLLAMNPSHSYLAKFALPDSFATFFTALTVLGVVLVARKKRSWAYVLLGFAAGVTILARLQAAPLVACLVFVAWAAGASGRVTGKQLARNAALTLLGGVLGHVLFNPFVFLTPAAALQDLKFIFTERYTGTYYTPSHVFEPLSNAMSNWDAALAFLRPYVVLPSLVVLVWAAARRHGLLLGIALSVWVFTIVVSLATGPRVTYWLPSVVPFALLLGIGLYALVKQPVRWIQAVGLTAVFLIVFVSGRESAQISAAMSHESTQTLAYDYVTAQLPAGSRILIGDPFVYSVPLSRSINSIQRLRDMSSSLPPSYEYLLSHPDRVRQPAYDLYSHEYVAAIQSDEDMRNFIREHEIDFIIQIDYCTGQAEYGAAGPISFPIVTTETRQYLEPVFTVSPFKAGGCDQSIPDRTHLERMQLDEWAGVGPVVTVYRVGQP